MWSEVERISAAETHTVSIGCWHICFYQDVNLQVGVTVARLHTREEQVVTDLEPRKLLKGLRVNVELILTVMAVRTVREDLTELADGHHCNRV